jgi:hypothetical protein
MTYLVYKTNGDLLVELEDGEVNTLTTSLTLLGNDTEYGERFINENFILRLGNFANTDSPPQPMLGQTWYDTRTGRVKSYNGQRWVSSTGTIVSPEKPEVLVQGDIWIDSDDNIMYFFDGLDLTRSGPVYSKSQGLSGFTTETIRDTLNERRVIVKLWSGGKLLGIFSKEFDPFTPMEPIPGYEGDIGPGYTAIGPRFDPNPSTRFNANFSDTEFLLNRIGQYKPAESFMFADEDTGTVGTVTIQNVRPLIFGNNEVATVFVDNEEFKIDVQGTNFTFTQNGTPLLLLTTDRKVGIRSDSVLVDTLSTLQDTTATENLYTEGLSSRNEKINVKNKFLRFNYGETAAGVTVNNVLSTSGLSVERGQLPNVSLFWNEPTKKWSLTFDGSVFYDVILGFPTVVAETTSYDDILFNRPEDIGLWRTSTRGNIYYKDLDKNVSIGTDQNRHFRLTVNGLLNLNAKVEQQQEVTFSLDISRSNHFTREIVDDTVFEITNYPQTSAVYSLILTLKNAGLYEVEFWRGVMWPLGECPMLNDSGYDTLGFITYDSGNTWFGVHLGTSNSPKEYDGIFNCTL